MSDTDSSQGTAGPTAAQSAALLESARYSFSSTVLASMTFGMYLVLAYQSIRLLVQRQLQRRGNLGMLIYSLFMFAVTTIWFCVGTKWSSVDFLEGANNPDVFQTLQCSDLGIAKDVFATLLVLTADGLLVWRTFVIWERNLLVVSFPILIYLSVFGTGIALNLMCADVHYGGTLHYTEAQTIAIPTAFWSLSVALNVITTLLVAFRLLAHRREMLALGVGLHDSVREYTSVVGILAESAALYAVLGLVYIPLFVHNVPVGDPFSTLFAAASFLCPALIQLRVARGVAYTSGAASRDTGRTITEMQFEKDTEALGATTGSDTMRGTGGTVNASGVWGADQRSGKSGGSSAEQLPGVEKTRSRTE